MVEQQIRVGGVIGGALEGRAPLELLERGLIWREEYYWNRRIGMIWTRPVTKTVAVEAVQGFMPYTNDYGTELFGDHITTYYDTQWDWILEQRDGQWAWRWQSPKVTLILDPYFA